MKSEWILESVGRSLTYQRRLYMVYACSEMRWSKMNAVLGLINHFSTENFKSQVIITISTTVRTRCAVL